MPLQSLRHKLPQAPPVDLKRDFDDFACVALILKQTPAGFALAFIRRAENPQDPWSGHVAFPGGRAEKTDVSDRATALRETLEETGWLLTEENFVGYLTDLQARSRRGMHAFFLRPLVFLVNEELPLDTFDPAEVGEVFWASIAHLNDPANMTTITVPERGGELPGITMPGGGVLWGLTWLMTQELLAKLPQ